MGSESLQPLSFLYLTSCGLEGKSPETLRLYAETLKIFMPAVERFGSPHISRRDADYNGHDVHDKFQSAPARSGPVGG